MPASLFLASETRSAFFRCTVVLTQDVWDKTKRKKCPHTLCMGASFLSCVLAKSASVKTVCFLMSGGPTGRGSFLFFSKKVFYPLDEAAPLGGTSQKNFPGKVEEKSLSVFPSFWWFYSKKAPWKQFVQKNFWKNPWHLHIEVKNALYTKDTP